MRALIARWPARPLIGLPKSRQPPSRDITCKPAKGPEYWVRHAMPADYPRLVGFMQETYLRSEPSIVNIGLAEEAAGCPSLVSRMDRHVRSGLSLVVEDRLGCVVGAAVNLESRREALCPPGYHADRRRSATGSCECPAASQLLDFFESVSRASNIWHEYGTANVFECAHVAVHPEHRGKGIARRLVLESWLLGRDLGYRAFRIDCSSRYTAAIARDYGWRCVYALPFGRYLDDAGQCVFNCVREPHSELQVYADGLDYCDGYLPPRLK